MFIADREGLREFLTGEYFYRIEQKSTKKLDNLVFATSNLFDIIFFIFYQWFTMAVVSASFGENVKIFSVAGENFALTRKT